MVVIFNTIIQPTRFRTEPETERVDLETWWIKINYHEWTSDDDDDDDD